MYSYFNYFLFVYSIKIVLKNKKNTMQERLVVNVLRAPIASQLYKSDKSEQITTYS